MKYPVLRPNPWANTFFRDRSKPSLVIACHIRCTYNERDLCVISQWREMAGYGKWRRNNQNMGPSVRMWDIKPLTINHLASPGAHNFTAHMTTLHLVYNLSPWRNDLLIPSLIVNDVCIHPNQGELISCDQAGSIKQWDLSDNICSHELVSSTSLTGPAPGGLSNQPFAVPRLLQVMSQFGQWASHPMVLV